MVVKKDLTEVSEQKTVRRPLRQKVLFLFGFIVLFQSGFLLTLLGFLEHTERQLNEERHDRDVVASIARFVSTLQTTSISIINQIRFEDVILDRFKEIFTQLPRDFENLKALLENDPDAAGRVKELESTTLESLDVISKVNSSYRLRSESAQDRMLHNHYCVQLIDCSRSLTRQIDELEDIYRERQTMLGNAVTTQSDNLISLAVVLGFAVNACIAIAIYLFFVKGIVDRLSIVKENTINLAIGKPLLEPVDGDDEVALLDRRFREMNARIDAVKSKESEILEHAANFICSVNRKFIIESVPDVCSAMWGYRSDELVGRRLNSLSETDNSFSALANLSESQSTANFENQVRCADGTKLELSWSASLIENGSIVCVAQDVTERKRYTAQLKQSEERFRTIEERLPIAVISCDRNFVIESVNAAVRKTFRYQPNELLGKSLDLLLIEPDGKRNLPAGLQAEHLAELGPEATTEISVWRAGGEKFTAEVNFSSHKSSRGDRYLVCFRDVSARVELEKAKRDFVSMVSHDLRSPLTSLHGTLGMVAEARRLSQAIEFKDSIFLSAATMVSRLVELINDFLDMGKIESGQEHLLLTEVSVEELLLRSLTLAENFLENSSCRLVPQMERISVNADYNRVAKGIACLIEIVAFFNQNQPQYTVDAKVDAGQLRITVKGTSCVFPQAVKEAVNDGYGLVELDQTSLSSPLGLALCRTVLRAHGGSLTVVGVSNNEMFEAVLPL